MHEKQSNIISFPLNPSVTHVINSKSPGLVSVEVTPTISTAYSSFTGVSFLKMIYYTLPERRQHETGKILIFRITTDNDYFQFHAVYMKRMKAQGKIVLNKIEREKLKHAVQMMLPDLGGKGRKECMGITSLFHLYRNENFKFTIKKKKISQSSTETLMK